MLKIKLNESAKSLTESRAVSAGVSKGLVQVYDMDSQTEGNAPAVAEWLTSGEFIFDNLVPGVYTVKTKSGKFKIKITDVSVNIDDTVIVDVKFRNV